MKATALVPMTRWPRGVTRDVPDDPFHRRLAALGRIRIIDERQTITLPAITVTIDGNLPRADT